MWLPLQSTTAPELSQADLELDDPLMADGNEQCAQHSAHKKPSTSVLTVVRYLLPQYLIPR